MFVFINYWHFLQFQDTPLHRAAVLQSTNVIPILIGYGVKQTTKDRVSRCASLPIFFCSKNKIKFVLVSHFFPKFSSPSSFGLLQPTLLLCYIETKRSPSFWMAKRKESLYSSNLHINSFPHWVKSIFVRPVSLHQVLDTSRTGPLTVYPMLVLDYWGRNHQLLRPGDQSTWPFPTDIHARWVCQ